MNPGGVKSRRARFAKSPRRLVHQSKPAIILNNIYICLIIIIIIINNHNNDNNNKNNNNNNNNNKYHANYYAIVLRFGYCNLDVWPVQAKIASILLEVFRSGWVIHVSCNKDPSLLVEALCSDATVSLLTESERASCTSSGAHSCRGLLEIMTGTLKTRKWKGMAQMANDGKL